MQKIGGAQGVIVEGLRISTPDGLQSVPVRCIVVPLGTLLVGTGAEVDTGVKLPLHALVLPQAVVNVRTAEATGGTKTLKVGTLSSQAGGAADAFLNAISVSSTGVKVGVLANGAETLGTKLKETTSAGPAPVPYAQDANAAALNISATAGSADWVEFRGEAYLFVIEPFT
jgi:hypothetical protein